MPSAPHGVPVEPSVALFFLAAVAAAWRWLRAGDSPSGRRPASGKHAPEREACPPPEPFRRHRSPTARFAPARYAPPSDIKRPESPTPAMPPPRIAGRAWTLDPKRLQDRWEKRFRFRR